jgi:hypothetical protein
MATDIDAVNYLMLANEMIHALYPSAITVGEDVLFSYLLFFLKQSPLYFYQ